MNTPRIRVLLPLLLLGLLLAACRPIDANFAPPQAAATAGEAAAAAPTSDAGNAAAFSGLLTFDTGEALPAAASIQIEVLDVNGGFYPANVVARTIMAGAGLRSPIPFVIAFDRNVVAPGGTYVLGARVFDGDSLLLSTQNAVELGADAARGRSGLAVMLAPLPDEPATPGVLAGSVAYRTRVALPPDSTVVVELVDRTAPPYTLVARQMITTQGEQPPILFGVEYDPAAIDPRRTYALDARILIDNRVAFLLPEPQGVLTLGKPKDQVDLVLEVGDEALVDALSAEPEPADLMNVQVPFRREAPLPETAVVQVEIVDLNAVDADAAVLAMAEVPVGGLGSPLSLDLTIDQPVDPDAAYLMVGRILFDGDVAFEALGVPVLTQGGPSTAIALPMNATGAEAARQRELALAGLTGQIDGSLLAAELGELAELDPAAEVSLVLRGGPAGGNRAEAPIVASETWATNGAQPPLPFFLPYDRDAIDPDLEYVFEAAVLENGDVTWVTAEPLPVLTLGAPATQLEVELVDAATAPQAVESFRAAAAEAAAARAAEAAALEAARAAGGFEEYTVQAGDTLSSIAADFAVSLDDLRAANPEVQADLIYVGDVLLIPQAQDETPTPEAAATADEPVAEETPVPATTPTPAAAAGAAQTITGTVTYRQRSALPAGSLVEVQLIDVSSDPPAVVAQDAITTAGEQVPIGWLLTFTPTVANDGRAYGLIARIRIDGIPMFASTELTPAKAGGAWRTNVLLLVAPIDWTGGGPTPIPLPDWALTPTPEAGQ